MQTTKKRFKCHKNSSHKQIYYSLCNPRHHSPSTRSHARDRVNAATPHLHQTRDAIASVAHPTSSPNDSQNAKPENTIRNRA